MCRHVEPRFLSKAGTKPTSDMSHTSRLSSGICFVGVATRDTFKLEICFTAYLNLFFFSFRHRSLPPSYLHRSLKLSSLAFVRNSSAMDPSAPSARSMQAYLLAGIFLLTGTLFFVSGVQALFSEPFVEEVLLLFKRPWIIVTVGDYFVGMCFSVMYLYLRDGPSFAWIPSKIIAFLLLIFGNFILMWYAAYLLIVSGSFVEAYLPRTDQQYIGSRNSVKSRVVSVVFTVLLVFGVGVLLWASCLQTIPEGTKDVLARKYSRLLLGSDLMGIGFALSYVIVREGSLSCTVLLWILGFVVFGNTATCLYIVLMALEALRRDVPFEKVLLSKAMDSQTTSYA